MLQAFRLLAKLKALRGTPFDIFGYTAERKQERALIGEYEGLIDELLGGRRPANHALAVKLASIPDDIRGYGHVKDAHLGKARRKRDDLLRPLAQPSVAQAGRRVAKFATRAEPWRGFAVRVRQPTYPDGGMST